MLCCTVPEEYGGLGLDYLFDVVVFEELWRVGASGPGFLIHTDLVATYILSFGTEAQKKKFLPKMVAGEWIGSLGMTEPHAGSDLKAIRTKAVRDGNEFLINGQKVFISNGQLCDVLVLATKTDSEGRRQGRHAVPRRGGPRGLPPRQEPREARHARPGTPRSSSSTTSGCRPRTCSAKRARASR